MYNLRDKSRLLDLTVQIINGLQHRVVIYTCKSQNKEDSGQCNTILRILLACVTQLICRMRVRR